MHMDLGMNSTLILDFTPCTKGTSRHLSDEPICFFLRTIFVSFFISINISFLLYSADYQRFASKCKGNTFLRFRETK